MACKTPEKFFKVMTTPALPAGAFKVRFLLLFKGALALVTGGGSGLGKAIATMFAQLGADVAIAARRTDVLAATASEIRAKTGAVCEGFRMDVKDPAVVSKSIDEITKRFGKLPSIVVNNAAGNFIMATERLSPNAVRAVVDIVLVGTLNVTTEVCRRAMKNNQGCTVLSITTPYARHGGAFVVPSALSKAGVENMTRSLASEWAKYGMRFNVVAPGPIPTEQYQDYDHNIRSSRKSCTSIQLDRNKLNSKKIG
ncbi:hypothetical protein Y032_0016g3054 [Ancylostoma ceylanicum]|uniref:Oxidoreductase, short chain dehydrogenase/reductase family protein n=1 Tax=Ancylostoma ceylanicum TaxID=53326 RepID=A0A016V6U6_9BILA|nr:hypothetical protein Y032_0016g3054 [Ancylostoma ceylanicum]